MNIYMLRLIRGLPGAVGDETRIATIKAPTAEDALTMANVTLRHNSWLVMGMRWCEPGEDVSKWDTLDLYHVLA